MHDTKSFKEYLTERLGERNTFTKEKQENYASIKEYEQQKRDLIECHAENNILETKEQVELEIYEIDIQIPLATRTEAKVLKDRRKILQTKIDTFKGEMEDLEDQTGRAQERIQKMNEKIWRNEIKPPVIGQDVDKNEYWFFKDEPYKLFMKEKDTGKWGFFDDLDCIEELEKCLNPKGIREKKLKENLQKVFPFMKQKKKRDIKMFEKGCEQENGVFSLIESEKQVL